MTEPTASPSGMAWDQALARLDESATAPRAARAWGAEPGSLLEVCRSANAVFRFDRDGRALYLRITHGALRPEVEVASALDYLRHLAEAGAPVCRPVTSERGVWIETVHQGQEAFLATVVEAVPGCPVARRAGELDAHMAWGRALGALHRAAESYRPAPSHRFLEADGIWRDVGARIDPDDHAARAEYERIDAWRRRLPRSPQAMGLTHADVNASNALFDGRQVRLIDFDEPVRGWWAADVARPFRELGALDPGERGALRDAFLAGYRESRPFDRAWEERLPGFQCLKDLEVYTWLAAGHWAGSPIPGGGGRRSEMARLRSGFGAPLDR